MKNTMVLEYGKVYEVMRLSEGKNRTHNGRLGMGRADIVEGQEVLVSAYEWKTKKPLIFTPLHRTGLTGKIFTDEELVGTGFAKLFGKKKRAT